MLTRLTLPFRLVLVLALGAALFGATPARADDDDDKFVPGEVVVKLFQAADLRDVARDYNLDQDPIDQFGPRPIYLLRIRDGVAPELRAAALAADVRVVYAEPNFTGQPPEGRQRTPWAIGGDSGDYVAQWAPGPF